MDARKHSSMDAQKNAQIKIPPTAGSGAVHRAEDIHLTRSKKVMLSGDIAELYKVEARVLIQAVKRNLDRFPEDFMYQLGHQEKESLRSQIVISNVGRGG